MSLQNDISCAHVRTESTQLFFLFVGHSEPVQAAATLEMMRASALANRNIVVLRERYKGHCYHRGISPEYDSLDAIVRWQHEQIGELFPHVREIFCVGISAGALAALYTACQLRARAAWSLGGRVANPDIIAEKDRVAEAFYTRVIGRPSDANLTAGEHARLVDAFNRDGMRERRWNLVSNPDTFLARDKLDAIVTHVGRHSHGTDYHFYYAETNAIDRTFAESFRACPNVTLHAMAPPRRDWSRDVSFDDPDHAVARTLFETGQIGVVFADYLQVSEP